MLATGSTLRFVVLMGDPPVPPVYEEAVDETEVDEKEVVEERILEKAKEREEGSPLLEVGDRCSVSLYKKWYSCR